MRSSRPRLVIDQQIPYITGVFEPFCDCVYLPGAAITQADLSEANGLIVRTRTVCDSALLTGTPVSAIATATIGLDHIDMGFCRGAGIEVFSARGCNARAVAQWVFSALSELQRRGVLKPGYTLGIIGVGNVGRAVVEMANELTATLAAAPTAPFVDSTFVDSPFVDNPSKTLAPAGILMCDPPLLALGHTPPIYPVGPPPASGFVGLEEVLKGSDVVTLHTPLDHTTAGLVDAQFLSKIQKGAVLLNSARGELLCPADLLSRPDLHYCLDVWPGEPTISGELLAATTLATPHIAGYSARGKARGTTMVVQQMAAHFGISELLDWDCASNFPPESPLGCNIIEYDRALRQNPNDFEALRTVRP